MDASVVHGLSCTLMTVELALCSASTEDFISSFIANDDMPALVATLGMLVLVPCMGWLVVLRHLAVRSLVRIRAFSLHLAEERYSMHTRPADRINNWASAHGLLAALAFAGVAAFPGKAWPVVHHVWTCLFFFNGVSYMHISVRIDLRLQQDPLLQAGIGVRKGLMGACAASLIMYTLLYLFANPTDAELYWWASRFELLICLMMNLFWFSYRELFTNLTFAFESQIFLPSSTATKQKHRTRAYASIT